MKRKKYRVLAAILLACAAVMLANRICWTFGRTLDSRDFLRVEGRTIVNCSGQPVVLEGVNLGGWLIPEYWMCPFHQSETSDSPQTALGAWDLLEERFGPEEAQVLLEVYQDHWIREWDIRNIAALGCNVIRVPFWYRNFMVNPEGDWIAEAPEENPGFRRLDWVISTAKKYGVYVILDMHGCPGGQFSNQCSGSAATELYRRPEYQDAMEKLWTAIARRYCGESAVAAYDIMNEPQRVDPEGTADTRLVIYERMIRAIRQVDPEHIIALEAFPNLAQLPVPEEQDWENVIYEVHAYGDNPLGVVKYAAAYAREHSIPVYIGEFADEGVQAYLNGSGMPHTAWTYKGTSWENSRWFLYSMGKEHCALLDRDDAALIGRKWKYFTDTRLFHGNSSLKKLWKR